MTNTESPAQGSNPNPYTTVEDVLAVIAPGESCTYVDLIERLKAAGLPTAGVGVVLTPFTEPGGLDRNWLLRPERERQQRGELRCWMGERHWDAEVEGGWIATTLMIARRAG